MMFNIKSVTNIKIACKNSFNVDVYIKREDVIHPIISGNKYRKLKYNVAKAKSLNIKVLLTFGGAFSNHIAATAAVGQSLGLKTVGIIRGEELYNKIENNPTLKYAKACGMTLKFVSREIYRAKEEPQFIETLKSEFGNFYLIPEGGTNELAVNGCEEILTEADSDFDYVCTSVGTGGTMAGLINCSKPSQQVLGFSALKGDFLKQDISKFAKQDNWKLITDYHFGGYAKINTELIAFINEFKAKQGIVLDPIYTGKMLFGIMSMIENGYFSKGSNILARHTAGLQAIQGMNQKLQQKRLPLIK